MPVRAFEGKYPSDVAGKVLIDVSSEPEVPVYERLDAGPWIDGSDRIDIHATVRELHAAGDLGDIPVVVVTAGIIEDEWLATVPKLTSRAQVRLAGLSSNAIQVVATDSGHFVRDAPDVVFAAIEQVVGAARSGSALRACDEVLGSMVATWRGTGDDRPRSRLARRPLADGLDGTGGPADVVLQLLLGPFLLDALRGLLLDVLRALVLRVRHQVLREVNDEEVSVHRRALVP
jgi:hypothetical protein